MRGPAGARIMAESEQSATNDVSEAVREVFGKFTSEHKVLALLLALDRRGLAVQQKIPLAVAE